MTNKPRISLALLAVLVAPEQSATASAQSSTAALCGTVADPEGAVIPSGTNVNASKRPSAVGVSPGPPSLLATYQKSIARNVNTLQHTPAMAVREKRESISAFRFPPSVFSV